MTDAEERVSKMGKREEGKNPAEVSEKKNF